jgi:hypothetical protein
MDLTETIRRLRKERQELNAMILGLEQLRDRERARAVVPRPAAGRRGRKSMGDGERQEVSQRMKAYWAMRRAMAREDQP